MSAVLSPFAGTSVKPWQFPVSNYQAKGNGKVITDGAMTSGQNLLNSASQAQFTSADIGKSVMVSTSAGSYAHQAGTITNVNSPTQAVVSFTATNTTAGTPGAICYYGSDDTPAVQNAINAAVAYAQAHTGFAQVLFDNLIYIMGSPFVLGGSTQGNSQLMLPIIAGTAQQVQLEFVGALESAPLMHWLQLVPMAAGTVLASTRVDGTNDGTYGPSSILGGPINGFGGEPGTFSNMMVMLRGMGFLNPYNSTQSAWDFGGIVEANISSCRSFTAAVVPASSAPVPSLSSPANISHQYTMGGGMPFAGNQVACQVEDFSAEGYCYDFSPGEWTFAKRVKGMYAIAVLGPRAGNGVNMVHAGLIVDLQAENSTNLAAPNGSGLMRLDLVNAQTESITGSSLVFDTSNQLQGTWHIRAQGSAGVYQANGFIATGSGCRGLRFINELTSPGPVSGPQAAPAAGTAWPNWYLRDAWITLAATTITGLTITGQSTTAVAQNGLAGSPATYSFLLPSGASYTWTGTGTASHTVTLLLWRPASC